MVRTIHTKNIYRKNSQTTSTQVYFTTFLVSKKKKKKKEVRGEKNKNFNSQLSFKA